MNRRIMYLTEQTHRRKTLIDCKDCTAGTHACQEDAQHMTRDVHDITR